MFAAPGRLDSPAHQCGKSNGAAKYLPTWFEGGDAAAAKEYERRPTKSGHHKTVPRASPALLLTPWLLGLEAFVRLKRCRVLRRLDPVLNRDPSNLKRKESPQRCITTLYCRVEVS